MLVRTMRVRMAASEAPMVTAGRTRLRQLPRARDGKPVEANGEEQDEDGAEGEVREREAEQADEAEGAVIPSVAARGRAHSGRNGEQDGDAAAPTSASASVAG